jgi:hypothetical protein
MSTNDVHLSPALPIEVQADGEMLKGTLDMMILRTLVAGDAHGHTIAKVIERTSEDVLEVEQDDGAAFGARLRVGGWRSFGGHSVSHVGNSIWTH